MFFPIGPYKEINAELARSEGQPYPQATQSQLPAPQVQGQTTKEDCQCEAAIQLSHGCSQVGRFTILSIAPAMKGRF